MEATFAMLLWASAALAQTGRSSTMPARPAAMQVTIAEASLEGTDGKIYVNQACAIFPDLSLPITNKKEVNAYWNSLVCHVEGANTSERREGETNGNESERGDVEIREQEYVLENTTMRPEIFAVLERVPRGWRVNSDPKPVRMEGDVAVFEVHVPPRETVRLHVAIRHQKELKSKTLSGAPPGEP